MTTSELIKQAEALRTRIKQYARDDSESEPEQAAKAQVCEFLRIYAGPKSKFLERAEEAKGYTAYMVRTLDAIMSSFVEYLANDLATGMSPERRAQIDVVSDFLGQANTLLEDSSQHPAAAAMIIGAALEEYLRNWVENENLPLGNARPGIDAYAKALRASELISKQDVKDITAWAGVRNHAAHGEWEEVSDRGRIRILLEGVNLFMRQKAGG
jgi:hypothetical protein